MKIRYNIVMTVAAALAIVGCTKEIDSPSGPALNEVTFIGHADTGTGTRTALTADYNVVWSSGDRISVFASTAQSENRGFTAAAIREDESGLANSMASFAGMVQAADTYYAVYPYNSETAFSGTVISTTLPSVQTAVANSFAVGANISTAKASDGSNVLQFRNAGAIIGVKVASDNIGSITLSSGEIPMAGAVSIDVSGDFPVMTVAEGGATEIRLVAPQPEEEGAAAVFVPGTTYYFVVAPGEYSGLQLEFGNVAGNATCTRTTAATVSVARNDNKFLGEFTVSEDEWEEKLPESYTINGEAELQSFLDGADPADKETVFDLYITGNVTKDQISRISNRVAVIEGTLTFENIGDIDTWELRHIDMKGSFVMRNVSGAISPNGMQNWEIIPGDIVIANCPNFPHDWDPFQACKEVGGDIRITGPIKGFNARFFPVLEKVGGDFYVEGVDSFWDFTYDGTPGVIKSVGGDFTIIDCPAFTRDAKGFRGFDSIEHIGGNVTLRNTAVSFPRESSDAVVGLCIFKHYMETGVISADAIVTVEDSGGIVDMSTVTSCTGLASPAGE